MDTCGHIRAALNVAESLQSQHDKFRDKCERIQSELAQCRRERDAAKLTLAPAHEMNAKLRAERDRFRTALEWYADSDTSPKRARKALEVSDGEGE